MRSILVHLGFTDSVADVIVSSLLYFTGLDLMFTETLQVVHAP